MTTFLYLSLTLAQAAGDDDVAQLVKAAEKAWREGDKKTAFELADKAVMLFPKNPAPLALRAAPRGELEDPASLVGGAGAAGEPDPMRLSAPARQAFEDWVAPLEPIHHRSTFSVYVRL